MKNLLNELKNVIITVVVALVVCYCIPVQSYTSSINSYDTVVDKVVANTVYCTVNGQQYSFYSDDEGVYYLGENINVTLNNNKIEYAHSISKQVQGSIISDTICTDLKDCNDENIYLYAVQVDNGNIVYFDTIDNTWEQGDKVNLTINNSGAVVGVEWLK